jgi:hypothetical protein
MNPDNENMEKALRAALGRKAAPPDFVANVLARTRAPLPFPKPKRWLQRPFTLALAAALAALAIVPAAVLDYERKQEARGLKAKRDLLTALAITRDQLQQARERVRRNARNIQ